MEPFATSLYERRDMPVYPLTTSFATRILQQLLPTRIGSTDTKFVSRIDIRTQHHKNYNLYRKASFGPHNFIPQQTVATNSLLGPDNKMAMASSFTDSNLFNKAHKVVRAFRRPFYESTLLVLARQVQRCDKSTDATRAQMRPSGCKKVETLPEKIETRNPELFEPKTMFPTSIATISCMLAISSHLSNHGPAVFAATSLS